MRYPINNFIDKDYPSGNVMQRFGENPELYCTSIKYSDGTCLTGHNGWDIVDIYGTPIYPTSSQKVVEVKESTTGYGKWVRTLDYKNNLEHTYGHLSEITCELGQELSEKDVLGKMGNTGFVVSGSTPYWKANPFAGTHLHYGIRKFKLFEKVDGVSVWNISFSTGDRVYILDAENGYRGSVDPREFFTETKKEEVDKITTEIKFLYNLWGFSSVFFSKISTLLSRLVVLNK